MRENEKEQEELKASRPKKTLLMKKMIYSVLYGCFYSQPLIQNTKKTKSKSYYRGTKREEIKRRSKIQKAQ